MRAARALHDEGEAALAAGLGKLDAAHAALAEAMAERRAARRGRPSTRP